MNRSVIFKLPLLTQSSLHLVQEFLFLTSFFKKRVLPAATKGDNKNGWALYGFKMPGN